MGNSSSSEAPRKAPQKLSKPRPPSHVSASDFLSPSSLSASSGDRYCESYLAGSRPVLSSVEDFPALAHDSDVAYKDVFSNSQGALSGSRPHSEVTDVGSSTQLHEPQSRQRGQSSGVARSDTARWPERPKSVVYDSGPAQPVARALSLHSNRRQSQRSKALQNTQSAVSVATCESVPSQDALRRSPHPDDHDDGETPRREQAALPSIPVRRRSLIQTPGVATRLVRESPRVLAKTKLERRHTTIEGETLHVPAPRAEKYLSMTACVLDVEPRERAVTPCEADYQQLGGMKFGTLRITNGSPAITPASEPLEKEIVRGVPPTTWELAESSEPSWPLRGLAAPLNANIQQAMGTKASDDYAGNITPATALTSHPVEKFETAAQRREPSKPRVDDMAQPTPAQYLENQEVDASAPTSTPNDMDYLSPEVFDVRVDPNAKSSGRPPLPVPEKDGRGSVARSDSGFVSASTSSSSSSRAALSKADSGYSSSFSLRSFRIPTDIEERLHEHNGLFPTASKRIALRVESSQETLRTIVSMDTRRASSKHWPQSALCPNAFH
ncbi:CFEM domain-containing protein [Purpureocillium lavendulum]|uniref:CFEM domain-containing protein n=1 Tax=Purpureocillium lavendulum TaxID=1247861 RepID=A0AB34FZX2_9HYPO|nr:CFEM domain-containing protein [Purpureocillium lavendulum]